LRINMVTHSGFSPAQQIKHGLLVDVDR